MADPQLSREIDRLCDKFEMAFLSDEHPQIEDYLAQFPAEDKSDLLRELLLVELFLRTRSGPKPTRDDYLNRFSEQSTIVSQAFAHHEGDHQIEIPTVGVGNAYVRKEGQTAPNPSAVIGDYEILDQIGRGGMGIVYRARQKSANRIVALKVIDFKKAHFVGSNLRAFVTKRFQMEAFAAAKIEHDHIVTIYDVGSTEDTHYLAMQHVFGDNLSKILSKNQLGSHKIAEYLADIANAMETIHQAGIIHRDIKPGNILIDSARDRSMLADFGLARHLDSQDDDDLQGKIFGSPPYMSPEQTREPDKADERSDIYSLGATMYHMLVGRAPFLASTLQQIIEQVQHESPLLPTELDRNVDADLEAICIKCLEKDPEKRFQSAREVEEELRRYLRREPIKSRRTSQLDILWRWCLRNQQIASVVVGAGALLIMATLFAMGQSFKAQRALREKTKQEAIAREQRLEAIALFELARDSIDANVQRFSQDPTLKFFGLEDIRRDQLRIARDFYEQLAMREPDNLELAKSRGKGLNLLAAIQQELGEIDEALETSRQAVEIQEYLTSVSPDNNSKAGLADAFELRAKLLADERQITEASSAVDRAIEIRQVVLTDEPKQLDHLLAMARSTSRRAYVQEVAGDLPEAITSLQKSLDILEQAEADDPMSEDLVDLQLQTLNEIARLYSAVGNADLARSNYRSAIDKGNAFEAHQTQGQQAVSPGIQESLAASMANLGHELIFAGMVDDGLKLLTQSTSQYRALESTHPEIPRYRLKLAQSYGMLASAQLDSGQSDEAINSSDQSIQVATQLSQDFGIVSEFKLEVAKQHLVGSAISRSMGELEKADQQLSQAKAALAELPSELQQLNEFKETEIQLELSSGELLLRQTEYAEAIDAYNAAIPRIQALIEAKTDQDSAESRSPQLQLARAKLRLGMLYYQTNDLPQAETNLEATLRLLQDIPSHRTDFALDVSELRASTYYYLAQLAFEDSNRDSARDRFLDAEQTLATILKGFPKRDDLRIVYTECCIYLASLNDAVEFESWLAKAGEAYLQIYDPTIAELVFDSRLMTFARLGLLCEDRGAIDEAIGWYDHAIAVFDEVEPFLVDSPNLVVALEGRARCLEDQLEWKQAALDRLALSRGPLAQREFASAADQLKLIKFDTLDEPIQLIEELAKSWEQSAQGYADQFTNEKEQNEAVEEVAREFVAVLKAYQQQAPAVIRKATNALLNDRIAKRIRATSVYQNFLKELARN